VPKASQLILMVVSIVALSCPTVALAGPVADADLRGKTICWSYGATRNTYGKDGSLDSSLVGHGAWSLTREFEGWNERVHALITSAIDTKRWALFDRAQLDRWAQGRIGLVGDAAHSMLPFFAQGAAQATEDALALACCLQSADRGSVESALQRYEKIRRPRANHVLMMSRGREVRNHLPDGPEQQQRDSELATGDPLGQNAWLYGSDWESELLERS
jgi:2-polyprenyl-6-methoxyphenol hydroxylase-like FAD-dependent oxidoreductase